MLHDGFYGVEDIKMFPRELRGFFPNAEVVGNSDPANLLFWEQLVEWFPDAKWVVIERPFEEVHQSCRKLWDIDRASLWAMSDKLNELKKAVAPMVVDFHGITHKVAMDVAEYLGIDAGDNRRAEMLCRMNVQIEPSFLKEALERFVEHPPAWASRE